MRKVLLLFLLMLQASCASRKHYDYQSLKFDKQDRSVGSFFSDEYIEAFKKSECDGNYTDKCGERFLKVIHARMRERYYAAHPEAVKNTCDSHPVECKNEKFLEWVYISSHNKVVEIFERYNEQYGQDDLNTEWRSFLYRMHNPEPQETTVNHYNSQPTYQNTAPQPHEQPRKPTNYETQCRNYAWGTDCSTTAQ